MFFYLYATFVAAVLFDFGTGTPIPQVTPTFVCPQGYQWANGQCNQVNCPSTHFLHNGACYLRTEVSQPISNAPPCPFANLPCQVAVAPIPVTTQPCPVGTPPCQQVVASTPVVSQPCLVAAPSCQTVVAPIPVTQPCPVSAPSCQTVVAPIPVTQPCPVGAPSCQTVVAPVPVTQPCPVAAPSGQTVVAPIPVTQPCHNHVSSTSCPTTIAPYPAPCQTGTPSCPTTTNCQAPCPIVNQTPCQQPSPPVYPIIPTYPPPPPTPSPTPPPPPPTQPPPPPPPPPTRPRPEPIIECPRGTILLNGSCRLVYCGLGIYRDGKCIQVSCPEGSVWTGSRCEIPAPQNHTTLYLSNVINTYVNQTDTNRGINNTNNIVIYITESPQPQPQPPPTPKPTPLPTTKPSNCCVVITPNVCNWENGRYICRNRKHRRCGPICTSDYIYLKPPTVLPPPPPMPCLQNDCGYEHKPFYPDCSRCNNMVDENCSTYCPRSVCQSRLCKPVELMGYCDSYPGSIGCRAVDGCTQDWCGGY